MDIIADVDVFFVRIAAQFAQRNEGIDRLIMHLQGLDLAKGAVLVALLAGLWFGVDAAREPLRIGVLKTVVAALVAALISRSIQNFLPARPRPMNAAPDFVAPFGLTPEAAQYMQSWSSFPSDHAAMFFAIVAGLWLMNRRVGILALVWTVVVICLPRLYVGLHYASDIVGGAVLGITLLATAWRLPDHAFEPFMRWERRWTGPFYVAAFFFSYEFARLFSSVRASAGQLMQSLEMMAGL